MYLYIICKASLTFNVRIIDNKTKGYSLTPIYYFYFCFELYLIKEKLQFLI